MSDDGYAAGGYSPYSDLEDLLYDDEPSGDLADDLAAHAVHSPYFHDDPAYEGANYNSDWEYYSDDYYDDDPSILKRNPQDGSPIPSRPIPSRSKKVDGVEERGKKRKLVDIQDIPDLDLGDRRYLKNCMRGTVWAAPVPERDNVFIPGQGKRISLLKDWRQVFGTASIQDKSLSKRPRLSDDESWANNMSLADMGLRNERGSFVDQQDNKVAVDAGEGDGAEEAVAMDEETLAALVDQTEGIGEEEATTLLQQLQARMKQQPVAMDEETLAALVHQTEGMGEEEATTLLQQLRARMKQQPGAGLVAMLPDAVTAPDGVTDTLPVLPKDRRQDDSLLPSPPRSHQSPVLEHDRAAAMPIIDEDKGPPDDQRLGRARSNKDAHRTVRSSTSTVKESRKRKASTSPGPSDATSAVRSTASSRAKRMASSTLGKGDETDKKGERGGPVSTRSTRSREKL